MSLAFTSRSWAGKGAKVTEAEEKRCQHATQIMENYPPPVAIRVTGLQLFPWRHKAKRARWKRPLKTTRSAKATQRHQLSGKEDIAPALEFNVACVCLLLKAALD